MSDKITVEITKAELHAIVKYHVNCASRIPKALGAALMKEQVKSILPSGRQMRALQEEARALLSAHSDRAKELLNLLKQ